VIDAVTLDFGNTLVPVPAAALRGVVAITAEGIAEHLGPFAVADVFAAWQEERERQFREDVPQFREVDLAQRTVRILARLRGMAVPTPEERWDDEAAARLSDETEVAWAVDVYSRAFVDALPAANGVGELIERLAAGRRVAVLSNWPLAATIDRYCDSAGWSRHLTAIVVSQRVGTVKPHPAIFEAAREALGGPPASRILHVGDDWAADVVGAKNAGWRAGWLANRPGDSPLPGSERDATVEADAVLQTLDELEAAIERLDRDQARGDRGMA
jgi:FMN phosphatase YigB (HAD superfamily)